MWIFGQTLWTDANQSFTIRTPLLTVHDTDSGVGMTWDAVHPWSSPPPGPLLPPLSTSASKVRMWVGKVQIKQCGVM